MRETERQRHGEKKTRREIKTDRMARAPEGYPRRSIWPPPSTSIQPQPQHSADVLVPHQSEQAARGADHHMGAGALDHLLVLGEGDATVHDASRKQRMDSRTRHPRCPSRFITPKVAVHFMAQHKLTSAWQKKNRSEGTQSQQRPMHRPKQVSSPTTPLAYYNDIINKTAPRCA